MAEAENIFASCESLTAYINEQLKNWVKHT
jgi:hypothetical protein